jgi:hypothetical protein
MRRSTVELDEDVQPVMVPMNLKALAPMPSDRLLRLHAHLAAAWLDSGTAGDLGQSASPPRPEPGNFAVRVARVACSLCKGFCCKNGEDDGFIDGRTLRRLRQARPDLAADTTFRLYIERVPDESYAGSCIFHGKNGCTLDRELRSDICNSYFCGGLHDFLKGGDAASPVMIFAGEGKDLRTSPVLVPRNDTASQTGRDRPSNAPSIKETLR